MKRISTVTAAIAMLALGVAGPAAAKPVSPGKTANITCTSTVNADGTVTKTCVNAAAGPEDGGIQTEIDAD